MRVPDTQRILKLADVAERLGSKCPPETLGEVEFNARVLLAFDLETLNYATPIPEQLCTAVARAYHRMHPDGMPHIPASAAQWDALMEVSYQIDTGAELAEPVATVLPRGYPCGSLQR